VLDFGSVRLVNSSNIARLLRLRNVMAQRESRLVLCNMSTQVWSAFLITGLDKVFTVSDKRAHGSGDVADGVSGRG
jgi:anti-anti-sigma factor